MPRQTPKPKKPRAPRKSAPPPPLPAPLPPPGANGTHPPPQGGCASAIRAQGHRHMTFDRVLYEPTVWMVPGLIPLADLTLVVGESGAGKSSLFAALIAQATGGPLVAGAERRPAGRAIIYAPEDRAAGPLLGKLLACGAVLERVENGLIGPDLQPLRPPHLPDHFAELASAISDARVCLVLIDPLTSMLSPGVSPRDESAVRGVLTGLMLLARRVQCTILCTAHLRKDRTGSPLDWISGSKEWANCPRSVVALGTDPRDDRRRVIAASKASEGPLPPARVFALVDVDGHPRFELGGPCTVRACDISGAGDNDTDRDARGEAISFLKELLQEGEQRQAEVMSKAKSYGIKEHTLRRAKVDLGVRSEHRGNAADRYLAWVKPGSWPDLGR